jgi:hypothetical protein
MHYEDLELCRYHSGPLDSDSWHVPLCAIGWLEGGHPYHRGPTPIALVEQINSYLPPSDFVSAARDCPPYGSPQYFELLREANDGFPVPMVTWDEYLIEQRKVTDELLRRRQTRLGTGPEE